MNPALTLATARRVLTQLWHDPRTIVLLVAMPSVLMVLLRYVFDSRTTFSSIAPALLGILPFLLMFLVTSITTLRERSSGTLERLMTTPLGRLDLLLGYALAFALVAIVSVVAAAAMSVTLGLNLVGSFWWLLLVTLVDALLGIATGLFASAFARTEFQAVQLMEVVVLPQVLLCGLFHPRGEMATVLRWASDVMPVSYAVEALQLVARSSHVGSDYARDLLVTFGCALAALALGAATLRRRTG